MKQHKALAEIASVYKLLAGLLVLFAVGMFFQASPYVKEMDENQHYYTFHFLQEGDYDLKITYVGFEVGDTIRIYSDELVDSSNHVGVTLAECTVNESAGIVRIPISLPAGTYNLNVVSDAKVGYFAEGFIQSVSLQNKDNFFLTVLFLGMAFLILLCGMNDKFRVPLVLLGMAILASFPLFADFLYLGDDMQFHLSRIEGIYQAMRTGNFPVRLNAVQNAGYGDLSATMYPQLFLYPVAGLRFFGVSLMLCYKVLILFINIVSAFVSYYSVKNLCNSQKIGMWASILYTFSSYRLINVYIRCAIGESLAMAFLPMVIWGTYEVLWRNRDKWYILAFGMTCVLQSHVLSTEMYVLFMAIELVIWLIWSRKAEFWQRVFSGVKAVGLTLLLNAGFLIPFLYFSGQDLQCFHLENQLADYQTYLIQMFSMYFLANGEGLKMGSTQNEMGLSVGAVLLFGGILFCVNQVRRTGNVKTGKLGMRCLAYGITALWFSSWLFPWEPLLKLEWFSKISAPLQFPWRFLSVASTLLCIVAAIAIAEFSADRVISCGLSVLTAGLIFCSTCYCFDMICQQKTCLSDKMEVESVFHSDSMYMYYLSDEFEAWHLEFAKNEAVVRCAEGADVTFSDYEKRGTDIQVTTHNPGGAKDLLVFPLYGYPGYEIRVDGKVVDTKIHGNPMPFVACDLPEGTAHITVSYRGLPIYRAGDLITIVTVISVGATVIFKKAEIKKRMLVKKKK